MEKGSPRQNHLSSIPAGLIWEGGSFLKSLFWLLSMPLVCRIRRPRILKICVAVYFPAIGPNCVDGAIFQKFGYPQQEGQNFLSSRKVYQNTPTH